MDVKVDRELASVLTEKFAMNKYNDYKISWTSEDLWTMVKYGQQWEKVTEGNRV